MNWEEIVLEWSYRLPKGYPTMKDGKFTSKSELVVLNQILAENRIEPIQLSQLNNRSKVKTTLNEVAFNKETLIKLIQDSDLPENLMQYIGRQIDSLSSEEGVIGNLKDKGYDDQHSKRIFDKAVELDSYNQLRNYISNPDEMVDFGEMKPTGNLSQIFGSAGLSQPFLEWLFTYKPTMGGVNSGNAENLLRILLKGGHVPKKGDVGIPGGSLEAKTSQAGSGFRLRGQSGYGSGLDVSTHVFSKLATFFGDDLPPEFPDIRTSTAIQLYYDSAKDSVADVLFKTLVKANKITKDQIADIYTEAYYKLYKNYAGDIKTEVVLPSLRDDGSMDAKKLFPRLAALEFRYYADSEDWDGLIAVNHKKDYILLAKDRPFNSLADLFATNFKLTAPNTKPKATVQDSLLAFEFKG
jgi:hypothetical protein